MASDSMPCCLQRRELLANLRSVGSDEHLAVGGDPLVDLDDRVEQRRAACLIVQLEQPGAVLVADPQDVGEAARGDQRGPAPLRRDQGVGAARRAQPHRDRREWLGRAARPSRWRMATTGDSSPLDSSYACPCAAPRAMAPSTPVCLRRDRTPRPGRSPQLVRRRRATQAAAVPEPLRIRGAGRVEISLRLEPACTAPFVTPELSSL